MTRTVLLLAFLATLSCKQATGNAFDRAADAVVNGKFRQAAKLYAEAATNDADPVRRAKAEIRLANIEWRAMKKHDEARARLLRVAGGEHEQFAARMELARLAHDRKDYAGARAEARQAASVAKTKRERERAIAMTARVVVDSRAVAELRNTIEALRAANPTTRASSLLLAAALLAGDGASAMEAVDRYYHVSKFAGPPSAIAAAHAELQRVLPAFTDRAAIARGLAGVRFFKEAALVVGAPADIVAYASAIQRIEDLTNEYYRQTVLGEGDDDDLRDGVKRALRGLPPKAELAKRYGAYINIGETGNYIDLHYGHVVADRTLDVEQFGRKAKMRFVELDAMVSNGLGTWIGDGGSGDGGWATATEIYQVRPQYANGPLGDFLSLSEEQEPDPPGVPGLCKRLERQHLDAVAAELRARGLEGDAFRDAFLARVERDTFEYSILLHEGRHAIDKLSKERFATWELEYRAKLSQIGLASAPRPALASALDYTIGGPTPHGKANEKLANGLVAWMEANRGAIRGLDASQPMLLQADKLTDEQIRTAVRSLDPLAK